ncbi:N-acetylmuramoyl-L-alanine amidase [Sphingomonas cannabina]|uniref:N-acetylmuramoyl-L-alanine amidase family protein n=1 Tax=Sphingomonas cannabina TaxID=2899123 RepID=UPI001F488477|nr:N-acetylmuramoyl-L-alanine amidase [Sphingomonas cannabina]UIJ45396.1 N-acetylmuramoyl-L-alanine amidase [Sphingomonas cannabina]
MRFGWTVTAATRHSAEVLALLALFAGWLAGVPAWAGILSDVRVSGNAITLDVDGRAAEAGAFVLGGVRPSSGLADREHGGAHVVVDLARPAITTEGHFDGRSITFALRTVDDATFARAAAEGRLRFLPPFSYLAPPVRHGYSVSMAVPPPARAAPLPPVTGDPSRPLVVIDAGHGGHDPGALSPDGELREKDLTLKVARAIRDELLASGKVRVAMTRDDDRFLILQERYGIARRLGAKLFISVHCDSAGNPDATGATVYTLSEVASDKEAARLAARENKADVLAGVDLADASPDISSILIDLAQRETMNSSAGFAGLLEREARPLIATKAPFHRMASLIVLKAPDMPSVLFETGYISNQRDADFLNSREGRERIAEGVRRAVEIHFATRMASR